jgi:hypothetical protein
MIRAHFMFSSQCEAPKKNSQSSKLPKPSVDQMMAKINMAAHASTYLADQILWGKMWQKIRIVLAVIQIKFEFTRSKMRKHLKFAN